MRSTSTRLNTSAQVSSEAVLIPAALENQITEKNCDTIKAKVIVEGAMMLRPGMAVKASPWNPNAKPARPGPPAGAPAK